MLTLKCRFTNVLKVSKDLYGASVHVKAFTELFYFIKSISEVSKLLQIFLCLLAKLWMLLQKHWAMKYFDK